MAAALRVIPFARWSVVVVIALMGGALLATAWTTYTAVKDASATLIRGQANAFQQSVRSYLFQLGEPPSSEHLLDILTEESEAGLRYIALVGPHGQVTAEAGNRLDLVPTRGRTVQPPDEPRVVGGRVEIEFGARTRKSLRPRGWMQRPMKLGRVLLQFEPVEADRLRQSAIRSVGVGSLGAMTLLLGALGLVRWVLRQEATERQRERDRRLASLGEMSAVLAHEIRNPLASLKGNAQLLAQSLPAGEKPQQKAARVVEEAVRLESLTNDLLDYVRTGEVTPQWVDPSALLRSAAEAVSASDIRLHLEPGAPSEWKLDPERTRQLLVNLLENAVQAGTPVKASVALTREGQLAFDVEDSGPGIPESDRERIFEPFFTRRTQGTGLGLAVVKRVVELHGGRIAVENAPGGGARFRVVLPPTLGGR